MCFAGDAESVNLLRSGRPVCRKDRRCDECGRMIHKGETYAMEAFVYEGDFSAHSTCAHCLRLRDWLNAVCDGFCYGGVVQDFLEHWDEVYPRGVSFGKMTVMAKRRWREGDDPIPSKRMVDQAIASSIGHE